MSRTERMKLDWEHYLETDKIRMVESSDRAECGCRHCTTNKRFYKRQDAKKARRSDKALVCSELTEALKEGKLEEQPSMEENK